MRHSLLFAIPLGLLLALPAQAQQTPASAAPATSSATTSADASTPANLTPRQAAELHADLFMARKEYADAVRAYKQILENDRYDAQLLNKIGVAYQEEIDLHQAENYYKKAMKVDKTFASAVNNAGTVEYERKHYSKAIKYYEKALKIRTDMATIYTNLGYAYVEKKQYPEAVMAFRQALQIDPTVFDRKGEGGAIVQQRTTTDPGLFYFFVAKSYALAGDAEHAAHFLKLARDDGYKDFASAAKDPAFAKVIKDPRMQEVLTVIPSYATDQGKTVRD
jgi:tetratricopeptide (TPR) repeat protein